MTKTNESLWFLLCREDDERHQGLRATEDMCGVPPNFIFYEIVRKKNFNIFQQYMQVNHLSFHSLFPSYTTLQPFIFLTNMSSTVLALHVHKYLFLPSYLFALIYNSVYKYYSLM
jgi:hypothetical protein